MLASIHPLGERARRSRWGLTVTAHLLGSAVGGGLAGAAAAGLGAVVLRRVALGPGGALACVAGVCAAGALADAVGRGRLWPTLRRQVDRAWLGRYRGWVYGLGFGLQLGAGVTTIVTTAAVHATLLLAFLSRDPVAGLLVGTAFGAPGRCPSPGCGGCSGPTSSGPSTAGCRPGSAGRAPRGSR